MTPKVPISFAPMTRLAEATSAPSASERVVTSTMRCTCAISDGSDSISDAP